MPSLFLRLVWSFPASASRRGATPLSLASLVAPSRTLLQNPSLSLLEAGEGTASPPELWSAFLVLSTALDSRLRPARWRCWLHSLPEPLLRCLQAACGRHLQVSCELQPRVTDIDGAVGDRQGLRSFRGRQAAGSITLFPSWGSGSDVSSFVGCTVSFVGVVGLEPWILPA